MESVMIIGIAGGSGSGKTTLAKNIAQYFGEKIVVLRHDDYYKSHAALSSKERASLNYDHPDAFDTELLIKNLDDLREGRDTYAPLYDYTVHDRSAEKRHIYPAPVIILEGILIFECEELRKRLDMKIFVDTDPDVRLIRRIFRDTKKRGRSLNSIISQYLSTVKPMHDAFVEPSKKYADIIIPEGGKNPVAYEVIIDRIGKALEKSVSI